MVNDNLKTFNELMWQAAMIPVLAPSSLLINPYTGFEDPPSMYEKWYTLVWRAWLKKKKAHG